MPIRDPFDRYGRPKSPFGEDDYPRVFPAFRLGADVRPENIRWLWPGYLPVAGLTLLLGDPGVGKSLFLADLVARVSAGRPWPLEPDPPASWAEPSKPTSSAVSAGWAEPPRPSSPAEPSHPGHTPLAACNSPFPAAALLKPSLPRPSSAPAPREPGGALLVCPEDHAATTLVPRLLAAGANLLNVCILDGISATAQSPLARTEPNSRASAPFLFPDNLAVLPHAGCALSEPQLFAFDPLNLILSPAAQASAAVLSAGLAALTDMAGLYGQAVLAVTHLAKSRADRILYRARGPLPLVAAARSILLLCIDPDDRQRRILAPIKSIFGPLPPPLAFRIVPCDPPTPAPGGAAPPGPLTAARLVWEPAPAGFAVDPDLLNLPPELQSLLAEACDWLTDALAAGPRPSTEILAEGRGAGFSARTLHRAKRRLRATSCRCGSDKHWHWKPAQPPSQNIANPDEPQNGQVGNVPLPGPRTAHGETLDCQETREPTPFAQ